MGSRHRPQTGRPRRHSVQSLPNDTSGGQSIGRIHQGTIRQGVHQTLKIALCISILFHKETRRQVETRTRLSASQYAHRQKPISPPPHRRSHKQLCRGAHIHQARHQMGIQQRSNQGGRRIQSGVQNKVWAMGTNGDVFRSL